MNNKLSFLKFVPNRRCWSKKSNSFYISNNIQDQIWENKDKALDTIQCSLEEAIEITKADPGSGKESRNAISLISNNTFPMKDTCDFSQWSGYIYVDLDIKNAKKFAKLNKEKQKMFYDQLDYALQCLAPYNYTYIEHSNSKIGIHCMFWFDCERTEDNFHKYAKWIYELFRYKIDEYIKDFSQIFTDPECTDTGGKSKVFDQVYDRPWQKLYITTIDYIFHKVDGYCEDINIEWKKPEICEIETIKQSSNIYIIEAHNDVEIHHTDRFVVFNTLRHYGVKLNEAINLIDTIYKIAGSKSKHSLKDWQNECKGVYSQNVKLTTKRGLQILEQCGIMLDRVEEKSNYGVCEYKIEDYISNINNINNLVFNQLCSNRILLTAPTGAGKTEFIKNFAKWLVDHDKEVLILTPQHATNNLYIYKSRTYHLRKRKTGRHCFKTNIKEANLIGNETGIYTFEPHKINITLWDQMHKIYNDVDTYKPIIIIDEAHKMIEDDYRDAANYTYNFLQRYDGKEIYVTATPIEDMNKALHIESKINLIKERKNNEIWFVRSTPGYGNKILGQYLKKAKDQESYPHLVLANDNLWETTLDMLLRRGYVPNMYRRKDLNTSLIEYDQLKQLLDTELIDTTSSNISLMTNVAFQGINIKNEGQMVIIIPFFIWETSAERIEQIIGRARKANVTAIVICDIKWDATANKKVDDIIKEKEETEYNNLIDQYRLTETPMTAMRKLKDRGFKVHFVDGLQDIECKDTKQQIKKNIKDKYDRNLYDFVKGYEYDYFVKGFFETEWLRNEINKKFEGNKYIKSLIEYIENNNIFEEIIGYIQYTKLGKYATPHFGKVINSFITAKKIIGLFGTKEEFEAKMIQCKNKILNTIYDNNTNKNKYMQQQMLRVLTEKIEIPGYVGFNGFKEPEKIYDIIQGYIDGKAKGGAKGGANGSANKKVTVTENMKDSLMTKYGLIIGQEFESCSDLSDKCNVTKQNITLWIKKGWIKEI